MPSNNQRNNELEFTPTFGTQQDEKYCNKRSGQKMKVDFTDVFVIQEIRIK